MAKTGADGDDLYIGVPIVQEIIILLHDLSGESIYWFFQMVGLNHWGKRSKLIITLIIIAGPLVSWVLSLLLNATLYPLIYKK